MIITARLLPESKKNAKLSNSQLWRRKVPGGAAGLQNQSGGRKVPGGFDSLPSPPILIFCFPLTRNVFRHSRRFDNRIGIPLPPVNPPLVKLRLVPKLETQT